jgi:hypothetical protein
MKAIYFIFSSVILFSCSKQLLISSGASDNKPLLFNGEYETKELPYIEVPGRSIMGIPSFKMNNQNNNSQGLLLTFNGVQINKTSRVLPILSLVGISVLTQQITQRAFGQKQVYVPSPWGGGYYEYEQRLNFVSSYIIGLPVAGIINNAVWSYSALSGASQTLNYRLINENPEIDVFFYPKYDISKQQKLFTQDALIKARVSGATLIHKERIDSIQLRGF